MIEYTGRENIALSTIHNIINEREPAQEFIITEQEDKILKLWQKARDKEIDEALKFKASCELVSSHFQEIFDVVGVKKHVFRCQKKLNKGTVALYFIGDLHFGRTTNNLIENFSRLVEDIIRKKHSEITLVILGDLFETPQLTGMHESQIKTLDRLGVCQVIQCMDMIRDGVKAIFKAGTKVNIIGLTGNHDRFSKSPDSDPERIVGILGYEYLKANLGDRVNIQYDSNKVFSRVVGGVHLILHHGDRGFNNKSDSTIIQALGRSDVFNIIVSGHYHSASLSSGTNYIRMQVPSMNTTSEYELNEFISKTRSGYILYEDGSPTFRYFN